MTPSATSPAASDGTAPAQVHERIVEAFARGWLDPTPHAWDDLLDDDVVLNQPLLRDGRGLRLWQQEVARLVEFLPDLHGKVISWAGRGEVVFLTMRVSGTAGGRPLTFTATDRLELDLAREVVVRRDSFFDPAPAVGAVLGRPSAWWPWWRSGLGPLLGRRRLLSRRDSTQTPGS